MENKDRFGNLIYRKPYGVMLKQGWLLCQLGYDEVREKPNLFYKKIEGGMIYGDMRGSKNKPIWENTDVFLHWQMREKIRWKNVRSILFEIRLLREKDCPFRIPIGEELFNFSGMPGEEISGEDGYCKVCGRDFLDDGLFCDQNCKDVEDLKRKKEEDKLKEICEACGERIDYENLIYHHTSYYPEKVVPVHKGCHLSIHRSEKYPDLKPSDKDKDKFYNNPQASIKKEKKVHLTENGCGINGKLSDNDEDITCINCLKRIEYRKKGLIDKNGRIKRYQGPDFTVREDISVEYAFKRLIDFRGK